MKWVTGSTHSGFNRWHFKALWTRASGQFLGSRLKWDVTGNALGTAPVRHGRLQGWVGGLPLSRSRMLGKAAPLAEGTPRRERASAVSHQEPAFPEAGEMSAFVLKGALGGRPVSTAAWEASRTNRIDLKESHSSQGVFPLLLSPRQDRVQRTPHPHQQEALLCLRRCSCGLAPASLSPCSP